LVFHFNTLKKKIKYIDILIAAISRLLPFIAKRLRNREGHMLDMPAIDSMSQDQASMVKVSVPVGHSCWTFLLNPQLSTGMAASVPDALTLLAHPRRTGVTNARCLLLAARTP
jgi:hypothetical protein